MAVEMEGAPEADTALARLVASLADNKYFLGRRYAEWCTAAPALEAAVAAAAMAQDEIGHARSLYPLLRDVAGSGAQTEPETRTKFVNVAFLDKPFSSWTDFVAANFLFDTALSILLEAAEQSSLAGLAQRAKRIGQEEKIHRLHGEGWTRRLAASGDAVRAALLSSFGEIGQQSERWLDIADPSLVEARILNADAQQLRNRYLDRTGRELQSVGLKPAK